MAYPCWLKSERWSSQPGSCAQGDGLGGKAGGGPTVGLDLSLDFLLRARGNDSLA